MNCPLCGEVCRGEVCRCHSEPLPSALPQWRTDAGDQSRSMPSFVPPVESTMELRTEPNADDGLVAAEVVTAEESTAVPNPDAWRDEISARLNRFRSRRKIRPPRYPSLKLPFAPIEALPRVEVPPPSPPAHVYEPVSNHALALDMRQEPVEHHTEQYPAAEAAPRSVSEPVAHSGAKIIEFPDSHGGRHRRLRINWLSQWANGRGFWRFPRSRHRPRLWAASPLKRRNASRTKDVRASICLYRVHRSRAAFWPPWSTE